MTPRNWRKIRDRLAAMEAGELGDRIRQEFGKRQDAFLSSFGYTFPTKSLDLVSGDRPNFFFSADSVPATLGLVRDRLPSQVNEIVNRADRICQHRFDLLGYEDLDYGRPIDWNLDVVHGKRAPRKAFYKVRYLDFAEVGDSKITWELNRHQHLVTLAKAFRFTGDRRFADEALRQWRHWKAENPYPIGINWASSLEVAFRALSWIWTYHLLEGAGGLPQLRTEWLRGLGLHGRYIERYLSTYFSPNTHLLGEGVALFFLGVLCPELAAAERWKWLGWKIVLQEAVRQVRLDGFHFEQSTYYHVYALDFFLHSAILAGLNGIETPALFEETMERMLAALCALARGGEPPRFGDDDGGRVFDPRRNRAEHLLDPLATGAILFHRGEFKKAAGVLTEETLWLLGAAGARQWDDLEASRISDQSTALPNAGYYLLASGNATQLVVDAGPLGTQSGGHGHADALSVCLQSDGRQLLIDTGTYEYVGPGHDRELFRGTSMHNTLRVDGEDQAEPASPFSWKRLTKSKVEQWVQGRSFDLLVASHDGYLRLQPAATHQRWIFSLKNGVYLVRDVVAGEGKRRLDVAWHLGQDMQLVEDGLYRIKGGSLGLALLPSQGRTWAQEVRRESWSPAYGQKSPMTTLNFTAETALPAEFAVVLVTLKEAHGDARSFTRIDGVVSSPRVAGYRYSGDGDECNFFFAERNECWQLDSVNSDAQFVCVRRKPGSSDRHLMFCGGSYARLSEETELRCTKSVAWAELILQSGDRTVFSSDSTAIEEKAQELPSNPAS